MNLQYVALCSYNQMQMKTHIIEPQTFLLEDDPSEPLKLNNPML